MARAPAFIAFKTFSLKKSPPLSIRAICPFTSRGKSSGLPIPQEIIFPEISSPDMLLLFTIHWFDIVIPLLSIMFWASLINSPLIVEKINSPELKVLFNNLDQNEEKALSLHNHLIQNAPDGWRNVNTKELRVKKEIFKILNDHNEVERLFPIIKLQEKY